MAKDVGEAGLPHDAFTRLAVPLQDKVFLVGGAAAGRTAPSGPVAGAHNGGPGELHRGPNGQTQDSQQSASYREIIF